MLRMNILYDNMRSYNQQYTTTSPKRRKYILEEIQTSCNMYERTLVAHPSGFSLLTLAKSTCWSKTNKDWD